MEPEYISLKDAARVAHKRFATLRKLVNDGTLPAYQKGGKSLYIKRQDAEALSKPTRFVPPAQRRRRSSVPIHPDVRF